jgi:Uma2 family endonuclease
MTTSKPLPLSTERNVFNGIYYPDEDGLPLPDGMEQEPHFLRVMTMMRGYLEQYYDVIVSGNTFLYYEEGNRRAVVSPDCYVTFGRPRSAILPHNSYFTWHMGKVPDFVMEIGSESTARVDLDRKRGLYASLGIGEYWRYDPTPDSRHYGEPLVGERLEDGEYVRMDVAPAPDGILRGHSPALGLDLCWDAGLLQLYDPVRDVWVPDYDDLLEARAEAEARLAAEQEARQAAETRLAEIEAELRSLRGEA